MIDFLTTTGCVALLEKIIRTAKTELYLVSPYIRLDDNFYERLKYANDKGINIKIVFGKEEMLGDAKKFFASLDRVTLYYHEHLHAKCYFNEELVLLTSMNLYVSSSREKNREMGIQISKETSADVYNEIRDEVMSIMSASSVLQNRAATVSEGGVSESIHPVVKKYPSTGMLKLIYPALQKEYPSLALEVAEEKMKIRGDHTYTSSPDITVTLKNGRVFVFEHRLRIVFDKTEKLGKKRLGQYLISRNLGGRVYTNGSYSITIYPAKDSEDERIDAELLLSYFREAVKRGA